jgi:hypothetical protein
MRMPEIAPPGRRSLFGRVVRWPLLGALARGARAEAATPPPDATAHVQALIGQGAGGEVRLPGGSFAVRAEALKLPSSTTLVGAGRGTVLVRIGDGVLLDISGRDTEHRAAGCILRDITLDGGGGRGPLVRLWHASDILFDNVWSRNNDDVAVDGAELWDSRFVNCTWDWCSGKGRGAPAVLLRNAAAPSGLGWSEDNTNAVYFVNCRWESFHDGALWLRQGYGRAALSQIFLVNCKMETAFVYGPFLSLHPTVQNVRVDNLYVAADRMDPGAETPPDLIEFAARAQCSLRGVAVWLGGPTARSCVRARVSHPSNRITDVWVDGPGRPSVAVVDMTGSNRSVLGRAGFLDDRGGRIVTE